MSDARKEITLTDASGRKIVYREMNVLEQAQMVKIIGRGNPLDAQNQPYVSIAMVACAVVSIDGTPRQPILMPEHIDMAIARLGDEGYAAVSVESERRRMEMMAAAEGAFEQASKELAKN